MTKPEPVYFTGNDSSWVDAAYQVTARETQFVEKEIFEVSRQKAIAGKIFPTRQIGRGSKSWHIEIEDEGEAPRFGDNFTREDLHEVRKQEKIFYPVYMSQDFVINMVDSDAIGNSKFHDMPLIAQTVRNLSGNMADYREKVFWRGYDISGRNYEAANRQGSIDTSSLGILNTSGINTFQAGDGDSTVTTAGDGLFTLSNSAAALITDEFYGPYDMVFTPNIWSTLLSNKNATTSRSDLSLMNEQIDIEGNKLIRKMHITKALLNSAEATATGSVAVIARKTQNGNPSIMLGEAYPLMYLPSVKNAAYQKGKLVWAGIPGVLYPEAVALDTGVTGNAI
ncbi:MAG: hypothetical protein ACTSQB_06285 [Candidatus Heimdallarchaeota archaeon]